MLEVKNITIKKDDITLISGLSFLADDSQMLCISDAGRNTAGALLLAVMGLEPIRSGFVSIEGELLTPGSASEFRKDMAYLPENPGMPYDTMRETAHQLFRLQANAYRQIADGHLTEQMRQLGLQPELLDTPQSRLTRQELQLMMLALICSMGKKIILADHPTSGLDSAAARTVAGYLRDKADGGATVIVATDDGEIMRVAGQKLLLD